MLKKTSIRIGIMVAAIVFRFALALHAQPHPPSPEKTPLFQETFADLAAWRCTGGAFTVEGGRMVCSGTGEAAAVLADRRFQDFVLDVDLFRPKTGLVGVTIRRQDESAWGDAYYLVSQNPGHLRLIKKRGGNYDAALAEMERLKPMAAEATARLRVWAKGDHLRVWLNGDLIANVRDEAPLLSGGIGFQVGSGGAVPPARFGPLTVLPVDSVEPPRSEEIPPLGIVETLDRSRAVMAKEIEEAKARLAEAAKGGEGPDDAALQCQAELVHALLWRYYFEPRTNMVYTILEPHSGKAVLPSREDVLKGLPNANGWSTPIEDCAGYGNGRHAAWLVERYEVTRKPEHAEEARRLLAGLLVLGTIRPADASGFGELVRGVLPDGRTYYKGECTGSSGDNFNGYSYGLWRWTRSGLATPEDRAKIAAALNRTCYPRASGAFAAIAADATKNEVWRTGYEKRRKASARSFAAFTVGSRVGAASWTAVQVQLNLTALWGIESDELLRSAYDHARKANAWSRWKDVLAGLEYDEAIDEYLHRVKTVRNPLDGMLTVMLTGDREIIAAFLPAFRRVVGRYDFTAFRDQRQLTPFLGVYWLGVRCGALRYDPAIGPPAPEAVRLKPMDPNRNLIVTHFAECNPKKPRE